MKPREAADTIRRHWDRQPSAAVILGSGLGGFVGGIDVEAKIPFEQLPGFPETTALGHAGELICGLASSIPVAVLSGRGHFYEGYSFADLALPVQTVAELGADVLVLSNASGGLNPQLAVGDLMVICDHIDLMGKRTVPRGSAKSASQRESYDPRLIQLAGAIARRQGTLLHCGVYAGVTGPNYETRAEYRALRRLGADAVGMSTVPEVLAAVACGMRVFAISAVTNVARPSAPTVNDAQHVVQVAESAEPELAAIVLELVSNLGVH